MNVEVAVDPDPKAAREAVLAGLIAYNERFLGPSRHTPLAVTARDENGAVVGGASGGVYYDRLAIDLVWVEEGRRGQGLGSRILREIEAEGRRLGATRAFLDTFAFQAAPFYERQGYEEVARIPRYFGEHDRIYLTKSPL